MEPALTDEEVVARVRGGERALFEVLMRRHNQRVYRAVRGFLKDENEIEDVMQQSYVSAYANLGRFEGASRFSTWLVRIAINEAMSRLRRRKLEPISDAIIEEENDPMNVDPERRAASRELVRVLERAVDGLSEDHRVAFLLREIEGLSTSEAAECLGVTEGALKVRLHRAKSLVRDAVIAELGSSAEEAFRFHAPRCDRVVHAVLEKLAR